MKTIGIEGSIPKDVLATARTARKWALRVNGGHTAGICLCVSSYLVNLLKAKGYSAYCVNGSVRIHHKQPGHCYAYITIRNRKYILDVSADQFGKKFRAIVFGTPRQLRHRYYVTHFNTVNGFGSHRFK